MNARQARAPQPLAGSNALLIADDPQAAPTSMSDAGVTVADGAGLTISAYFGGRKTEGPAHP